MSEPLTDVAKVFTQAKIVPNILPKPPGQFLRVLYKGDLKAEKGRVLTPTQVKNQPIVEWEAEPDSLYTLIMTDPDAPSRREPKFREYHHWLVVNIPGNDVDRGEVLTGYVGSGPPKGSGLHRYVFLLYKQARKLTCSEERISRTSRHNRTNFSAAKFAKKYKLGDPIAGNFFQSKWDDHVPILYKQLSGK